MHSLHAILFAALLAGAAAAQELVADLRPGGGPGISSNPQLAATLDPARAVFVATTLDHGSELWVTDGTGPGTRIVKDLTPGRTSSGFFDVRSAQRLVFFVVNTVATGRELGVTDGSAAGTRIFDIVPGPAGSSPQILATDQSVVVFAATDRQGDRELWSATGSGFARVADLNGSGSSNPFAVALVNGMFVATRSPGALWKIDRSGTRRLRAASSAGGAFVAGVGELAALDTTRVAFRATTAALGRELWVSNGSQAGTKPIRDLRTGTASSDPRDLVTVPISSRRYVYLTADDGVLGRQVWRSDGVSMQRLTNHPSPFSAIQFERSGAGVCYLWRDRPRARLEYTQITDTTVIRLGNARSVRRFVTPGPWYVVDSTSGPQLELGQSIVNHAKTANPLPLTAFENGTKVLVAADSTSAGREPWFARSTTLTLAVVKDVEPRRVGSDPRDLTVFGKDVVFTADDGRTGRELWSVSSIDRKPRRADLRSGLGASSPRDLTAVPRRGVFFTADDGSHGRELWLVAPPNAPRLVRDIVAGSGSSNPAHLCAFSTACYFAVGNQFWASDGRTAGTIRLHQFTGDVLDIASTRRGLFILERGGSRGDRLWFSTGFTVGATLLASNLRVMPGRNGHEMLDWNGDLAISANESIWVSNGTATGTRPLFPSTKAGEPTELTPFGARLLFRGATRSVGSELFAVTANGLVSLVRDIAPGAESSTPLQLVAARDRVFFTAQTATGGREPWVSDGTKAGTQRLRELRSGTTGSLTNDDALVQLTSDRRVVFAPDQASSGVEPWMSDGTAAGTAPLKVLVPGTAGSFPQGFRRVATSFVFTASAPIKTGAPPQRELWIAPLGALCGVLAAEAGLGCPGTGGLRPRAGNDGLPWLGGQKFAVTLGDAKPGAPAAFVLADRWREIPLPGSSCVLYGTPLLQLPHRVDTAGTARQPLPIPADKNLIGAEAVLQWAVLDPAAGGLGVATSSALEIVIGTGF